MSITTLTFLSLILFALPLISVLVYQHGKGKTLNRKVCFVIYSVLVVYYLLYFAYGSNLLNYYFPVHSETKMVCEYKTTTWREGVKY